VIEGRGLLNKLLSGFRRMLIKKLAKQYLIAVAISIAMLAIGFALFYISSEASLSYFHVVWWPIETFGPGDQLKFQIQEQLFGRQPNDALIGFTMWLIFWPIVILLLIRGGLSVKSHLTSQSTRTQQSCAGV